MSGLSQDARVAGIAIDRTNREKDDFYPTPPDGTRALLTVERFDGSIWEPACGDGAISKILLDAGHETISSDLVDRGYGESGVDFLMEWRPRAPNIITNPPFKYIVPFVENALRLTTGKVAMLLRLACLEGSERRALYDSSPLARVWVFSRRLSLYRRGEKLVGMGGGMVAFAWYVWDHAHKGPPTLGWI